ncbi:MAG: LVIVD repeat-containing protein [Actinomycetota bacterium]
MLSALKRALLLACILALVPLPTTTAGAQVAEEGEGSPNMRHVANLGYEARNGTTPNSGTDIEFTTIGGRDYALGGSYRNGMQIVDITNPEQAQIVAVYDCGVTQGDIQVFRRGDMPGRTFVTYTSDTFGDGTSTCYQEAAALGFEVKKANGSGKNGTFIADITNPLDPQTVSFVEVPKGSHNQTVHPGGRFLYNSNSDLITSVVGGPSIEVFNIKDFSNPKLAADLDLPIRPGLGTESHDITFNESGTRAYSAALSQQVIINTRKPNSPSIVTSFVDPAINVFHQSDPVTLNIDGYKREFLIIEDEFVGALPTGQCPNGGVHVYDITGHNELDPEKVGYWNIDEARPATDNGMRCTAHVFDIHQDEGIMTIAFYNGGVRVVDISGLVGVAIGETEITGGMKQIGYYQFPDSDSWSAKTPEIDPATGDFYLYGNDLTRGMDIYHFDAGKEESEATGTFMSPADAELYLADVGPLPTDYEMFCLIPE